MAEPLTPHSPSEKRPVTIHDVAAALGMHKSTVSLALSGKGNVSKTTQARVLEVANSLGYSPNPLAQRLARATQNSLVALCSGGLDVGLATGKILLVQNLLGAHGLEAPIYTLSDWPEQPAPEVPLKPGQARPVATQALQMRSLCRQHPRAIVCAAQELTSVVWNELSHYRNKGGLVVTYDVSVPFDCDQVVFNREDNAHQAARALIEAGHTDIGFAMPVGGHWPSDNPALLQNQRILGWKRALRDAGLVWRDEWMFVHRPYETGGEELAAHFLALPKRPTAVCIVNDYAALAFMVEVARAGVRVPEDVSLVGHDNQTVARYCPVPLSSVSQPVEQIARGVAKLLFSRLDGDTSPSRRIEVRGEFIERQSIARR